jgi:uncharacterized protein
MQERAVVDTTMWAWKGACGIRVNARIGWIYVTLSVTTTLPAPVPPAAHEHMVRMRDGVRLATDVYLPEDTEPTQAVLVRLCYDKDSRYTFMDRLAPQVTGRGYAFVVQDVRGKFRSEGATLAFVHESRDGYDTLDWVVSQPWSDGKVGMFGDSYYGFTQWAAVSSGHPALRAIVPRVTSADLGMLNLSGRRRSNGSVEDVDWLVAADYMAHYWLDKHIQDFPLDYEVRPISEIFEGAFRELGQRSATYGLIHPQELPVPVYPDGHPFNARPLPVLHAVGWFDNLQIPHMRDYVELMSRPGWAPLQYLTADSVDHENYHLSLTPITSETDHGIDDDALDKMLPVYLGPALDFFDVFLKEARPVKSLPRVRWHLGHSGYRESATWPPAGTHEQRLFLSDLQTAASGPVSGGLSSSPSEPGEAVWVHNPHDLVPSAVANSFAFLEEYPDEASTRHRDDVLAFDGEAVGESLDLAGPVDLYLRVESTAPTTDIFAKLLDVSPDGSARMIARGQGHLTAPAAAQVARVEMGHTGYRLREQHRLRLHICSSDFPEFVPHPGTGDDPWFAVDLSPSRQTLHTSPEAPSYVAVTVSG